jgi:para-aminobenzoate synthetase / 4-amino-4-deoxychorismate lyase
MNVTDTLHTPGTVLCRMPPSFDAKTSYAIFSHPSEIISAYTATDILPALERMQKHLEKGHMLAGFFSYEAAEALDPAHTTLSPAQNFPLLWFGLYSSPPAAFNFNDIPLLPKPHRIQKQNHECDRDSYCTTVHTIKNYIASGDIYQANITFRTGFHLIDDPVHFFYRLFLSHPVPYSACVNTGEHYVISNSPELFLESDAGKIRTMPMKGTAARLPIADEDRKNANWLEHDEKNRAENVMIVDMMRNDLGRICRTGSIHVRNLFRVHTFPTVHQMTTEIHGHLLKNISLQEIISATFPPASITGAPKIRAMQIIAECERSPRKVYTGSIGCFTDTQNFCLNVAIRTIILDKNGTAELGIGSGIVADSIPENEWDECLLKSAFVTFATTNLHILETMIRNPKKNEILYLEQHLKRAQYSLAYFGWKYNHEKALDAIKKAIHAIPHNQFARIRLLISPGGFATACAKSLPAQGWGKEHLKICISESSTHSKNIFLYHKTTQRSFYDNAYKNAVKKGCDEIIFTNENNYLTEGAISSIFIRKNKKWYTPAIKCGLLPGIWRQIQIKKWHAKETLLTLDDLLDADEIVIGNSVRGAATAYVQTTE